MRKKETLNIDRNKNIFKGHLSGICFKEGDYQIIYVPSLEISSYGEDLKEANSMMKKIITQYGKDLLHLTESKMNKTLTEMGWQKSKFFKRKHENMSDTTFEDIRKEFNLPDDIKVRNIPIAV